MLLQDSIGVPLSVSYWPVSVVLCVLLCVGAWRDLQYRGAYLGTVFGGLAELVFFRRIEAQYHLWAIALCITGFLLLRSRWAPAYIDENPTAVDTSTRVDGFDALLADRHIPPPAIETVDKPTTGLAAFFVTAMILLIVDTFVVPRWLN